MRQLASRREFLAQGGIGLGSLALAALLAEEGRLMAGDGRLLHGTSFRGAARHVILLFMGGGPSQVDTFDPKPELARLAGQKVPESIAKHVPRIVRQRLENLFPSPFRFQPCGQSGLPISSLFPHLGQVADELCVLRSMSHTSPVHTPAEFLATTGSFTGTRPSLVLGSLTAWAVRTKTCPPSW
jgi:hypothetical protein